MKKLLIVMLAVFTASIMFYSCADDSEYATTDTRVISFVTENEIIGGQSGYKTDEKELIDLEVEIRVVNGEPKLISDAIEEKVLKTEDGFVTMFVYKGEANGDVSYRSPAVMPIGYLHSGYLFNSSSGCFVHCNYIQGDNGVVMALSCCVNLGDCTGLDPICPNEGGAFG